jgi:hypothetical protein
MNHDHDHNIHFNVLLLTLLHFLRTGTIRYHVLLPCPLLF